MGILNFILQLKFCSLLGARPKNMVPSEPEDIILHKKINAFGKKLSVVRLEGEDYLIGVQIATLLRRETFNMYRSMKIKNIHIKRANPDHVDYLCKCNAVRPGTHSVTLIPYESGLYFVAGRFFFFNLKVIFLSLIVL